MTRVITLLLPTSLLLIICGCSREQPIVAAQEVGKAYNTSYRDGVIKNWQAFIVDSAECATFKDQLKVEGERHDSAASGSFVMGLTGVKDAAAKAGCVRN